MPLAIRMTAHQGNPSSTTTKEPDPTRCLTVTETFVLQVIPALMAISAVQTIVSNNSFILLIIIMLGSGVGSEGSRLEA